MALPRRVPEFSSAMSAPTLLRMRSAIMLPTAVSRLRTYSSRTSRGTQDRPTALARPPSRAASLAATRAAMGGWGGRAGVTVYRCTVSSPRGRGEGEGWGLGGAWGSRGAAPMKAVGTL